VDGYGQFCPVALGSEIFAQRWTPLILRELLLGSHSFSALKQGLPRISRNLLVQRLAYLEEAGVVERRARPSGRGFDYHPTAAGEELRPIVFALGAWGYKWTAQELRPENLDAGLLMWFLRRRVQTDFLPEEKVVARFEFWGAEGKRPAWLDEQQSFWLVLDKPDVELCLSDPGFDVGLTVRAELATMIHVYLGHVPLGEALRAHDVELSGRRDLVRGFRGWLGISHYAHEQPVQRRRLAAAAS
jgi:DNA-binding HxlR family transcriptional regulator